MDENQRIERGLRYNHGKLPWHLIPWDAVAQVASVLRYGAKKYAARNWEKGLSYSETHDSLMRHLRDWYDGQSHDPESKELHLAHVACNALFLLAFAVRDKDGSHLDDRPCSSSSSPSHSSPSP
jgi:hypothetical protein